MEDANNNEEYIKTLKAELTQYKLVASALQAQPEQNGSINEFVRITNEDFLSLANKEKSCPNEAEMYSKLLEACESLRVISTSRELYTKNTGAIGGGFSSGKSSFINSFVKDEKLKLPTGIEPVTYIPSYVSVSDKPEIKAHTGKGSFDIPAEVYKTLSHSSKKVADLKTLIPYITVSCPMDKNLFGNICLIDTPGYNPPGQGYTQEDEKTAKESIQKAHFLIWIIDIENGEIKRNDIDFLKKLPFGKEPKYDLYIVLNKAYRKSEDSHAGILDTVADTLDDNDFNYSGISVYDSLLKKEYSYRKTDLKSFLKAQNAPNENAPQVDRDVKLVLDTYKKCIEEDKKSIETRLANLEKLNSLLNTKNSNEEIDNILEHLLTECKKAKSGFDEQLKELERIRDAFRNCIVSFCKELGIPRKRKKFCDMCGAPFKEGDKFCSTCGASAFAGL